MTRAPEYGAEEHGATEAREWLKHNEAIPNEAVLAEYGLTNADFERMGQTPLPTETSGIDRENGGEVYRGPNKYVVSAFHACLQNVIHLDMHQLADLLRNQKLKFTFEINCRTASSFVAILRVAHHLPSASTTEVSIWRSGTLQYCLSSRFFS